MISVDVDAVPVERFLSQIALRQYPFATASALNSIAYKMRRKDLKDEMRRVFDVPTSWTLNAFNVNRATKHNESASLEQKSSRKWLHPQVEGGSRKHKAFEAALVDVDIMPKDRYFVPGDDARLNRAGNMRGGDITSILSDLSAHREVGYQANVTARSRKRNRRSRHFVIGDTEPLGGEPIGIGQRKGRHLSVVGVFVKAPTYKPVLDLDGLAGRVVARDFPAAFETALGYAVATAR